MITLKRHMINQAAASQMKLQPVHKGEQACKGLQGSGADVESHGGDVEDVHERRQRVLGTSIALPLRLRCQASIPGCIVQRNVERLHTTPPWLEMDSCNVAMKSTKPPCMNAGSKHDA